MVMSTHLVAPLSQYLNWSFLFPSGARSLGNLTAGLKHALYVVSKLLSIIIVLAFVIMLIW